MKRIILITTICAASVSLMAQGRLSFGNNNSGAGIDAPVRDAGGLVIADSTGTHSTPPGTGTLLDSTYKAQGYWSLVDNVAGVGFTAFTNNAITFVANGQIASATRTLSVAAGTTVFVQMRAWKAADGATYEAALANGGTVGFSRTVPVLLVGPAPAVLNAMTGLTSFEVGAVPEPSTIALGAFGLLAAWMIRRRK